MSNIPNSSRYETTRGSGARAKYSSGRSQWQPQDVTPRNHSSNTRSPTGIILLLLFGAAVVYKYPIFVLTVLAMLLIGAWLLAKK